MLEVGSVSPEQALTEVRKPFSKLRELILGGYDFTEEEKEDPVAAAEFEYS